MQLNENVASINFDPAWIDDVTIIVNKNRRTQNVASLSSSVNEIPANTKRKLYFCSHKFLLVNTTLNETGDS